MLNWRFLACVHVIRRVWIRASVRYLAIVLRINRALKQIRFYQLPSILVVCCTWLTCRHCPLCRWRPGDNRHPARGWRRTGPTTDWSQYWGRGNKIYMKNPCTNKIPDIESEDKSDRDQVRVSLNNQTVLLKLILLQLNVLTNERIFG